MDAAARHAFADTVRRNAALSVGARLVAAELLARFNSDEGGARPSRERIAEDLGLSLGSVKRHLRELTEAGVFDREERRGPTGVSLPTLYAPAIGEGTDRDPLEVQERTPRGSQVDREGVKDDPVRGSQVSHEPLQLNPSNEPFPVPSEREADLKALLWSRGVGWLVAHSGRKEAAIRPLLGKWLKHHSETTVYAALQSAMVDVRNKDGPPGAAVDPVGWIEACLSKRPRNGKYRDLTRETASRDDDAILGIAGLRDESGPPGLRGVA